MPGPTLETLRLILRPPAPADFDAFAEFAADAEVARFLGGAQTRSAAWRSWCMLIGAWSMRGYAMFSVVDKHSGAWLGRVGPWYPEGWPGRELGWGIVRSAHRRGYGAEAARAAMAWAFDELGWTELVHCIDPANLPSIALAEQLGSRLQTCDVTAPAPLVARWDLYGQTRGEWAERWPPDTRHYTRVA